MKSIEKLQSELIHALASLSIEGIEEVWEEWSATEEQARTPQIILDYCKLIADSVIQHKREKLQTAGLFESQEERAGVL